MMKRYEKFHRLVICTWVLFVTIGACPLILEAGRLETVRWVDDGDTIVLENSERVRYIGINAPEVTHKDQPAEPYGDAAKKFNIKLVYQKQIRLEYDKDKKDRHGRLLAYVYLKDGLFVNDSLIRQGYAHILYHKENNKHDDLFLKAQREAMKTGKGMWHKWQESGKGYIGNRNSRRFHLQGCAFAEKIARKNRVYFITKWDAFWAGFAPAKQCLKEYWK